MWTHIKQHLLREQHGSYQFRLRAVRLLSNSTAQDSSIVLPQEEQGGCGGVCV